MEHYLAAWRYEISFLELKKIFYSFAALTRDSKRNFIFLRPFNMLYIYSTKAHIP